MASTPPDAGSLWLASSLLGVGEIGSWLSFLERLATVLPVPPIAESLEVPFSVVGEGAGDAFGADSDCLSYRNFTSKCVRFLVSLLLC